MAELQTADNQARDFPHISTVFILVVLPGLTSEVTVQLVQRKKSQDLNRMFTNDWTEKYPFILPAWNLQLMYLICSKSVPLVKSGNVKHPREINPNHVKTH